MVTLFVAVMSSGSLMTSTAAADDVQQISMEDLRDRIRGGLLGQMLGNLNGIPHEFRYNEQPGNVEGYVPSLPEGAWTDDDTDFEWVYILEMQRRNRILLEPSELAELWKARINRRIWCSNLYARQLMDLGLEPPLTGQGALNPWAEFNISGQFLCETFGLIAPGMPQTASRIGLNYTTIAIDLEPAQTTQLFTTMIANAFFENDINTLLDAGLESLDEKSEIRQIVADVRQWQQEHPDDWRKTRQLIKEKYTRHGDTMRDRNGYELNTAATIAALLYGDGDLPLTLQLAFNMGWDCDNSAATAGTIVGVTWGYRRMLAEGWQIVDRYRNTSRDNMPNDETITSFADRLIDLAEMVISENGGKIVRDGARQRAEIVREMPTCVHPLTDGEGPSVVLQAELNEEIEAGIRSSEEVPRARAAYLATCLGMAEQMAATHPDEWKQAVEALQNQPNILQVLFHHSDVPGAVEIRNRIRQTGIQPPTERKPLWE